MSYVLGMDGGGTATLAEAFFPQSGKVLRFAGGALNTNGGDRAQIARNLLELLQKIEAVCGSVKSCDSLCLGAAGVSNDKSRAFLAQCLKEAGYTGPMRIAPDSETALYGAFEGEPGAILIAGTGSICYGLSRDGQTWRTGGLGYLLDDEGSGYRIGQAVLFAAARAWDGRLPGGRVFAECLAKEGVRDAGELVARVYNSADVKGAIASFARFLPPACESMEETALAIADDMARQLTELAAPVIERLRLHQDRLALCGGVCRHHPRIREGLVQRLAMAYPRLICMEPLNDAACGARLMALKLAQSRA